jgi:hypothetical protein
MKLELLAVTAVLLFVMGCNLFSGSGNNAANSVANNSRVSTNAEPAVSPTPRRPTRADFAGRWGVERDFKDHVIEFREDGSGSITLDENGKAQAKQDFSWTLNVDTASFEVKDPIVNSKLSGVNSLSVHAKLIENGTKLQTDYSPYTRSKGDDTWDKK